MPKFLGRAIAYSHDLIPLLMDILEKEAFCGRKPPKLERIKNLLGALKDQVSFMLEYPYVDRHYRDTYYTFHSSKFVPTGRNCIRIHLFDGKIDDSDFFTQGTELNDKYLGFFVVRPLLNFALGRSLISPKAFKANNFVCCLMKARISLLGKEFKVFGFPHIAQDTETHSCAESALWSFIEYFGSKYSQYKPLLPSQIIRNLLDSSEHRILPSMGLTKDELAKCLHNNGFQCLIYPIVSYTESNPVFRLMRIYIESGIPLLLVLGNRDAGHAVLVIGHENDMLVYTKQNNSDSWIDISFFNKKLVYIDDNFSPYQVADPFHPTEHYPNDILKNLVIKSFIVPLPTHVFLVAEKAYGLIENIFNDPKIGLSIIGGEWFTRLLLTGAHSFKQFVSEKDDKIDKSLKKYLLLLALPRFVWICEIYKKNEFSLGCCSGLLIIDATGTNKSLMSVLWYTVDRQIFLHDGLAWNKVAPIKQFQMSTYKNNLKGEWSQWKS
jgi:hypothetical protein